MREPCLAYSLGLSYTCTNIVLINISRARSNCAKHRVVLSCFLLFRRGLNNTFARIARRRDTSEGISTLLLLSGLVMSQQHQAKGMEQYIP